MKKNGFAPLIIILIVTILGIVGYFGYKNTSKTNKVTPVASATPKPLPLYKESVSGSLKKIDSDLGLVKSPDGSPIYYYYTGVYTSGPYNGYKRILEIDALNYGTGDIPFCKAGLFLTKDNKTYVAIKLFKEYENKSIITSEIDADVFPNKIDLGTSGELISDGVNIPSDSSEINLPCTLKYENSNWKEISTFGKYHINSADAKNLPVDTNNKFIVTDETGLPYQYYLAKEARINTQGFGDAFKKDPYYLYATRDYRTFALTYSRIDDESKFYTKPVTVSFGNSSGTTNNITINGFNYQVELNYNYPDYPDYIPDFSQLTPSDFTEIYSINNTYPVYGLIKNPKTEAIYKTRYQKITGIFSQHEFFLKDKDNELSPLDNPDLKKPTFDEYVAKNPFLFIKDPWGNYMLFEENQYYTFHQLGGGKPVIYLYPTQKMQVSISFNKEMDLAIQIPEYHEGWKVEASPNGILTDLQPQFTNCNSINRKLFGSEYAFDACKNNQYPYIYWAGYIHDQSFPLIQNGWTVSKNNLTKFLDDKLTQIGLNSKEREDMLSYWVPTMEKQNTAYYHVAFLLTDEMNRLVPMTITPKPDTMLRVFLDWAPLTTKPTIEPQPQIFQNTKRSGFTYVEWGGLKW